MGRHTLAHSGKRFSEDPYRPGRWELGNTRHATADSAEFSLRGEVHCAACLLLFGRQNVPLQHKHHDRNRAPVAHGFIGVHRGFDCLASCTTVDRVSNHTKQHRWHCGDLRSLEYSRAQIEKIIEKDSQAPVPCLKNTPLGFLSISSFYSSDKDEPV